MIPFNKPYFTGKEEVHITEAGMSGKISGDGMFTKKCHAFFEQQQGFKKVLLTTSCSDALEMAALLLDIKAGDEVIAPSFTFVSTVNAFVLRGAKIVFVDSRADHPDMDADAIEALITPRTKAIVPVHYAGVACDMDKIMALAKKHNLFVVEDAAHAIDAYYKNARLGTIGHLAAFSFHETKNIICGEGGMLAINDERFMKRAEIIREKGTNRPAFFRGEVGKYEWVDIGSSFLPSDMIAAFLFAQIEHLGEIQRKRKWIYERYRELLAPLEEKGWIALPKIPSYATNNGHMFYVICKDNAQRGRMIDALKSKDIQAVFHYQSLHKSKFYADKHDGRELPWSDAYSARLLRLPFFYALTENEIEFVCESIRQFLEAENRSENR